MSNELATCTALHGKSDTYNVELVFPREIFILYHTNWTRGTGYSVLEGEDKESYTHREKNKIKLDCVCVCACMRVHVCQMMCCLGIG